MEHLQDDIVAMVERTGGARASTTRASSSASTADIKDPFLRRLFDLAGADAIAGASAPATTTRIARLATKTSLDRRRGSEDEDGAAAKEGGPDEDAVKAVDAIKAKAAATKAALVAVLDAVDERSSPPWGHGWRGSDPLAGGARRGRDPRAERLRERTAKQRKRNEELAKSSRTPRRSASC